MLDVGEAGKEPDIPSPLMYTAWEALPGSSAWTGWNHDCTSAGTQRVYVTCTVCYSLFKLLEMVVLYWMHFCGVC